MDDMQTIEQKMKEAEQKDVDSAPVPAVVEEKSLELAAPAVLKAAKAAMDKAEGLVNDPKSIDKHAKDLSDIAHDMIENQLETEHLKNARAASENKVARKQIENDLYEAKQKGIRLRKEAKHESKLQRARHKEEIKAEYWAAHKDTLTQYGLHEGSSRVACEILLWLDGVKGFFNGLSKVSDAIVKALKWILIAGGVIAALMIIPATRNWLLALLGFIK